MVVATEGRRYDVRLRERKRYAVYWEQMPTEVRRCSWFHKGSKDVHFSPHTEELSDILEVRHREGQISFFSILKSRMKAILNLKFHFFIV